jgi:hypothetical protein
MFILAHSFKDFSSWLFGAVAFGSWQYRTSWQECVVVEVCLPHGAWKTEGEEGGEVP